jgi:3-dehydroquinate synthase
MKEISLTGSRTTSRIFVGMSVRSLADLRSIEKTVVITDSNVYRLHGEAFSRYKTIVIEAGEKHKTFHTVQRIYEDLLDLECDRSSFILGIGGGVVCDVAGFVASTYVRGLSFGFVPTTLLAQVDASVGGKNAVNFKGYKNLVGTINQPAFVLCDPDVLKTLTRAELKNGFAEVVKQALIGNADLFNGLEKDPEAALSLRKDIIEEIVYDSLMVKTGIVAQDETEQSERRKLNFGHTFGHALEKTAGLSHGEAVSVGMVMETRLSEARGLLEEKDVKRIVDVLDSLGLPTAFKGNREGLIDAIKKDKKREDGWIHSVLLKGVGKAVVEAININEIMEIADDMCQSG